MQVEVVFALPERQFLERITLPDNAVVADAIRECGVERQFPDVSFDDLQAGIWGAPVEKTRALRDGDRVEIYRALALDPREARRLKAGV